MIMVDSLTEEEIDKIADAVVKKLLPILKELSKGSGFLTATNVVPMIEDECEQQAGESVKHNLTGFNESLYE